MARLLLQQTAAGIRRALARCGGMSSASAAGELGGWGAAAVAQASGGGIGAAAAAAAATSQAAAIGGGLSWVLAGAARGYASTPLKPAFTGGKLKPYSSYKGRFKTTGNGHILYQRPGHVHKRFNKSKRQLSDLSQTQQLHEKYAKVMRRLGFVARSF